MADALVEIRNALLPGSPAITTVSDSSGIAVIPSVPEGTYNVRVSRTCSRCEYIYEREREREREREKGIS